MTEPKHIGKYEILTEIGRGDFAVVYRARHAELHRVVALKVLDPTWTAAPGFAARFRRETRAVVRLRHPSIVTVYEAGEADGHTVIATEHRPGDSLRKVLTAEGVMSLEQALPILQQVGEALDYAHAQGVIHRDVRPENVVVEETKRGFQAALSDFGLAALMQESTPSTSKEALLGSVQYWAPEQVDPKRAGEVGPAADLYALGVVAYEMLAGQVPFSGEPEAVLQAQLRQAPPPPHDLCPHVPAALSDALLKMLAKAPAKRFVSGRAFSDRLRTVLLTESQAVQQESRIVPLYERLQDAVARDDWTEVLRLGELIQVLDAGYRDVPGLMERARAALPKRRRSRSARD